jgi:hypothetical protein
MKLEAVVYSLEHLHRKSLENKKESNVLILIQGPGRLQA